MAVKGLTTPYYAKYAYNNGAVSYSDGGIAGHAINYSFSGEKTEDNPLYGDNKIIEMDYGKFKQGTLTVNTDNLSAAVSKAILGIKEVTRNISTTETPDNVTELVWDDEQTPQEIGFGIIETMQVDNVDKYRAIIFARVAFNIDSQQANTMGETVEWQTPTITGKVYRSQQNDSNYKNPWKYEATFDTEAKAEAYIKAVLNIAG